MVQCELQVLSYNWDDKYFWGNKPKEIKLFFINVDPYKYLHAISNASVNGCFPVPIGKHNLTHNYL